MDGFPLDLIADRSDHKGAKREWIGRMGRSQAASLLSRLAEQVGAGNLQLSQGNLSLPDDIVVEVELKIRPSGNKLEVELKWPGAVSEFLFREGRPAARGQDGPESPAASQARPEAPATFRGTKSDLKTVWKLLLEPLKQGHLPEPPLVERIEQLGRLSAGLADPEWRHGMEEFLSGLDELRSAVAAGDLSSAQRAASYLDRLRRDYHRKYK